MSKDNKSKYYYKKLKDGRTVKVKKQFKNNENASKNKKHFNNRKPASMEALLELQKHFNNK
jgi:hypothetical protein